MSLAEWANDWRLHTIIMTLYFCWYLYRRDNWQP